MPRAINGRLLRPRQCAQFKHLLAIPSAKLYAAKDAVALDFAIKAALQGPKVAAVVPDRRWWRGCSRAAQQGHVPRPHERAQPGNHQHRHSIHHRQHQAQLRTGCTAPGAATMQKATGSSGG